MLLRVSASLRRRSDRRRWSRVAWLATAGGYEVTLQSGEVACRNAAGRRLKSVPPAIRDDPVVVGLRQLTEWLARHEGPAGPRWRGGWSGRCRCPRRCFGRVWPDEAWRAALTDLVVAVPDARGAWAPTRWASCATSTTRASAWSTSTARRCGCPPTQVADPAPGAARRPRRPARVRRRTGRAAVRRPALPARPGPDRPGLTRNFDKRRRLRRRGVRAAAPPARPAPARWATRCAAATRSAACSRAAARVEARFWVGADDPSWEPPRPATWCSPTATARGAARSRSGRSPGPRACAWPPRCTPAGSSRRAEVAGHERRGTARRGRGARRPTRPAARTTVDTLTARAYRHPALDERHRRAARAGHARRGRGPDPGVPRLRRTRDASPRSAWCASRRSASRPGRWSTTRPTATTRWPWSRTSSGSPGGQVPRSARPRTGFDELGERLARRAALPADLLRAGRRGSSSPRDNPTYAATHVRRAREAERAHALPIDEERQHAVFLEFALAGALTVKALSAHARDLAARADAGDGVRALPPAVRGADRGRDAAVRADAHRPAPAGQGARARDAGRGERGVLRRAARLPADRCARRPAGSGRPTAPAAGRLGRPATARCAGSCWTCSPAAAPTNVWL